ncbi:helix-turn-helix transcriptional regulator [Mesorhizobium sp. 10J20-29]
MGRRSVDDYSEERVAAISAEIGAAIDSATFGSGSWDDVPAALSRAFPGSWGGLYNMNFPESRLNFLSFQNMDPAFVRSYAEHFAYVNPWATYWNSVRSTTIAVSELVSPARSFAHTEFYNDWLLPQKDAEAAVGMKLVGDRDEAINVLLHYPLSLAGTYDRAAAEIMQRIRGSLELSIALARQIRVGTECLVAEAALIERCRCAAFVVDSGRVLRTANHAAELLFSLGRSITVRNGRCYLSDVDADARFAATLDRLTRGTQAEGNGILLRTAAGAWQITMARLPAAPPSSTGFTSLLPPQQLMLVLMTDLCLEEQKPGDFSVLAPAFRLAPAEIALCRRLFLGDSVSEAAENLGITLESARTRLKIVLHKTGTSRQGQLMLLLSKLR